MRALPADVLYGEGGLDVAGLPMIFQPVVGDGGGQLQDQPLTLLSKGRFDTSTEVLVGHNQYEGESAQDERFLRAPSSHSTHHHDSGPLALWYMLRWLGSLTRDLPTTCPHDFGR